MDSVAGAAVLVKLPQRTCSTARYVLCSTRVVIVRWFRYHVRGLQGLSAPTRAELTSIPGVKWSADGDLLTCPGDLGAVVDHFLRADTAQGFVAPSWTSTGAGGQPVAAQDLPFAQLGDLRLLPHQERGLARFQQSRGGLVEWPAGSGKTTLGVLWALTGDIRTQRVVVVVQASTIWQWVSRIGQITSVPAENVYVVEGLTSWDLHALTDEENTSIRAVPAFGGSARDVTPGQWTVFEHLRQHGPMRLDEFGRSNLPRIRGAGLEALVRAGACEFFLPPPAERVYYRLSLDGRTKRQIDFHGDAGLPMLHDPEATLAHREVLANWRQYDILRVLDAFCATSQLDGRTTEWMVGQVREMLGAEEAERAVRSRLARWAAEYRKGLEESTLAGVPEWGFVLVGWPVLSSRLPALLRWKPTRLIIDEVQNASDGHHWKVQGYGPDGRPSGYVRKTTASASASALAEAPSVADCLTLTATPVRDRPRGLWSQMRLLDPKGWGKFREFQFRYLDGKQGEYGFDDSGVSNAEELAHRIAVLSDQVTADEAFRDVPPILLSVTRLPLEEQAVHGIDAAAERRAMRAGGAMAVMHHKLDRAAEAKIPYGVDRALAALDRGYEQVMILTGRPEHARAVEDKLLTRRPNLKVLVGTGQDSDATDRRGLVETFRSTSPCVLIGTIHAWMVGIDGLQGTPKVVILCLPWNIDFQQLLGRFRRLQGDVASPQRSTDCEVVVAEDTIDMQVLDTVIGKMRMASAVLRNEDLAGLAETLTGNVEEQNDAAIEALTRALIGLDSAQDEDVG